MSMGRARGEQFWITKGQLAALGVTTAAVAVLTFFVGVMVGRSQSPPPSAEQAPAVGLIAADVESDALTELLARVEQAASSTVSSAHATQPEEGPLEFPDQLVAEELELNLPDQPPQVELPEVVVDPEPQAEAPVAPEEPADEPPEEGWAVQVFSFPDAAEANAKVSELQDLDYPAYRVDALVKGDTWHRVRIGPYSSKEQAAEAQGEINEALGTWDSRVTTVR